MSRMHAVVIARSLAETVLQEKTSRTQCVSSVSLPFINTFNWMLQLNFPSMLAEEVRNEAQN